jgi:hypothetical protein
MSTESVIAYFGIHIKPEGADESEVRLRRHPLVLKARSVSLQTYWGTFGSQPPSNSLLIGKKLSILGIENEVECLIPQSALTELMADVLEKLKSIELDQEPQLILMLESS